jgi:hypothetical protein
MENSWSKVWGVRSGTSLLFHLQTTLRELVEWLKLIELLPGKHEALNSNPRSANKTNKKNLSGIPPGVCVCVCVCVCVAGDEAQGLVHARQLFYH